MDREECDSTMVAQSRLPVRFDWAVHLVLRDGTHHRVHATLVPFRGWFDRRLRRQVDALNAWICAGRPAPSWALPAPRDTR